jgi:hypothetical protein
MWCIAAVGPVNPAARAGACVATCGGQLPPMVPDEMNAAGLGAGKELLKISTGNLKSELGFGRTGRVSHVNDNDDRF